ncbi:hypothetical protein CEP53_000943 [Fusarium sp. AF-6]|nr:hypothetical protein CEP53_000943 [Fusarium sp. AF-6]
MLADPSPSSTAITPPVAGTPLEPPPSASNELSVPGTAFYLQPGYQWRNIWGAVTPEWTQCFPSDRHRSPWMFIPEVISETSACQPYTLETESEESDALDELQGLEIGLGFLDESEDEDESIDDEESSDDDEKATSPADDEWVTSRRRILDIISLGQRDWAETMAKLVLMCYLKIIRLKGPDNLECPCCQWNFNSEFDVYDICTHFRCCGDLMAAIRLSCLINNTEQHPDTMTQFLIDNLQSFKWVTDNLQLFIKSQKMIENSQEELPDWDELLQTAVHDLALSVVTAPARAAVTPSTICDALLDALKERFQRDENTRHILDVGVHLARHKREIEQLFAKAQARQQEWDSMDDGAREMEKARINWVLECESSIYGRLPKVPQFNVLRDLNMVVRSRYQQFCQPAAGSPSPALTSFILELQERCPKPKDLRRLGTRIFKQVIQGTSPTTLLEIFAFISLSQAMTTVMRRRDVQMDLDPRTIDYLSWRTCIEDEASRGLYDEILIAWFYPQWKDELHSGESNQSPLLVQEAMKRLVLQLMNAKQTNGAFRFSAFLRLGPFPPKQTPQGSICTSRDDDCEPPGSPIDTSPDEEEKNDLGRSGTEELVNTVIFIGVWLFMIYIAALGVALLYLGNPEQRCHLIARDGEEHVASAHNVVLTAEKMKDKILDRLRQHPSITALDGIVKAVEEVLDGGYIWSVSDLHIYLEKAVQS